MRFFNALGFKNQQEDDEQYTNTEEPPAPQQQIPKQTTVSHSYFEKKGEVNELKRSIKTLMEKPSISTEDLQDILKKIISVMTLGIDLSSIFTDVLMLSYTNDIISKKMIYLYLMNYAETNEETSIMAMNTFLKDCVAKDGKIRGLALRTLCGLKTESALEYIRTQVLSMLDDSNPYVRKIAILGCLKLFYIDNEYFEEKGIVDKLYGFLKDPNKYVVESSIHCLNEIMAEEGGMVINNKIVLYLVHRFDDFDNYGKQTVLSVLSRYKPKNDEEMFSIMNLLEESLKLNHIPLVMSIIKTFVNFTIDNEKVFEQVVERIIPTLISLTCMAEDEELFNILNHVVIFTECDFKRHFLSSYKLFYVKAFEKNYNQDLKIRILVNLTTKENINNIMEELIQYAGERDIYFAKYAIKGLGELIKRFSDKAINILKVLLSFINMNKIEIIKHINSVLKDVLPHVAKLPKELTAIFESFYEQNKDEESIISLLCIICEIPTKINNSPYILDAILTDLQEGTETYSDTLILYLLNAVVRCFVVRSGEMLPVLSKMYEFIFNEEKELLDNVDLIERASYYYNMLKTDLEGLKASFEKKSSVVDNSYKSEQRFKNEIREFGLDDMRIIYKKPEDLFIKEYSHFQKISQQTKDQRKKLQQKRKQEEEESSEEEEEESDEESEMRKHTFFPFVQNILVGTSLWD